MPRQFYPAPGRMQLGRGFDGNRRLCVGSHSSHLTAEWRRRCWANRKATLWRATLRLLPGNVRLRFCSNRLWARLRAKP
jgi:hypothetical protein